MTEPGLTGRKPCLKTEHMPQHGDAEICPVCGGEVLRFRGEDPGLDDLMDAPPVETLVVKTRAGFNMWLEDAGTDPQGRRLWRQLRVRLGNNDG